MNKGQMIVVCPCGKLVSFQIEPVDALNRWAFKLVAGRLVTVVIDGKGCCY